MSGNYRADGLNNPLSGNNGFLTWAKIEAACDESDAVESYEDADGGLQITWCDGSTEVFADPTPALNAIRAMEQC